MLSTIIWLTIALLSTGAFLYFWKDILEFLNGTVRGIIEKVFGKTLADQFGELLNWLDSGVGLVKRTAQSCYDWFKSNVLKIETEYDIKKERKITVTQIKLSPNEGQETRIEEKIDWHELPDEVRAESIRNRTEKVAVDDKAVVDRRFEEQMLAMSH